MSEASVDTKINEASPRKVQKWLFKRLPETRAGGQRERVESMGEALPEPDLLCPFCSLLKDGAVIAKCCFATACKICAEEAAAKGDPCVACGGRVVGADLRADPDTRRRVDRYRRANPVRGTQSRSNLIIKTEPVEEFRPDDITTIDALESPVRVKEEPRDEGGGQTESAVVYNDVEECTTDDTADDCVEVMASRSSSRSLKRRRRRPSDRFKRQMELTTVDLELRLRLRDTQCRLREALAEIERLQRIQSELGQENARLIRDRQASREETAEMGKKLEWLKTDFYLHDHIRPRQRRSKRRPSRYSFEEDAEGEEEEDNGVEERRVRYLRSPPSSPPLRRREKSSPRLPYKHE